jgi:microcystin degradation protein MlrC
MRHTHVHRVGILGFFLECNRFAPITTPDLFAETLDLAGEALQTELGLERPRTLPDTQGFVSAMNRHGNWEPVALRMAGAQPGGPVQDDYFKHFLADVSARLKAAGPLDAVFISSHGAALTETEDDPEGLLFECVRNIVGHRVPVVTVLDLHANVTQRMTQALSGAVAYKTNPHDDLRECGIEAAQLIQNFWQNGVGQVAFVKLPFVPPATSQMIAPGTAYQKLMQSAASQCDDEVLNVSLCGGFALADATSCGFSVLVTSRAGAAQKGAEVAQIMALEVWNARHQFVSQLWALQDAVAFAARVGRSTPADEAPCILADVGDNPGGGGGGNTLDLLKALIDAQVEHALLAVLTDARLAQAAHAVGVGHAFEACFNQGSSDVFAKPFMCEANVLALSNGRFFGRRGLLNGVQAEMGLSARLAVGGVQVVVISNRQQLIDPAQLDALQINLSDVRVLVAKSRGHYRAAFDQFTSTDRMIDVDCPGLTSPNLKQLPWTRMPRPVFPIHEEVSWSSTFSMTLPY